MSDEDDIRFRDQCAIQILQAYIGKEGGSITGDFLNYHDSETAMQKDYAHSRMQRLVWASYLIADMMRKARLSTFE